MKFLIGTRGSPLALVQAREVEQALSRFHLETELKIIRTTGDRMQNESPSSKPAKGLFTKEIERELADGHIHIAVHSCKDLPTELPEEFDIGAFTKRKSVRDVLIVQEGVHLENLTENALILTGSPRRQAQWLEHFHQTRIAPVRGNLDTRIRKLREGQGDGILVAEAGLERLNPDVSGLNVIPLPLDTMLPAPGQGALALEIRKGDEAVREIVSQINHEETERAVCAERFFLNALGGGCRAPVGACAEILKNGCIRLRGVVYRDDKPFRGELTGNEPEQLGMELAEFILRQD